MKRFFWKLGKIRNYNESKEVTALVYKLIDIIENCPNAKVEIDQYYIVITTSSSIIKLWNENKFYAWLSRGAINERPFVNHCPSLDAMYDFKTFLEKKGYNIYPAAAPLFRIDDVKC